MDRYNNYSHYGDENSILGLVMLLGMLALFMFIIMIGSMSKQDFYYYIGVYIDKYLFRIKLKKFNLIYDTEINAMSPDKVEYLTIEERQAVKKSVKKALSSVNKFQEFLITDDSLKRVELVERILTKIRQIERAEKIEAREKIKNTTQ
jgi:hypothetical protein